MYFLLGLLMLLGMTVYFGLVLNAMRIAKEWRRELDNTVGYGRRRLMKRLEAHKERWNNG